MIDDLGGGQPIEGDDGLGRFQTESAGEDRQPAQNHLLVRFKEVVAPRLCRVQRPMSAAGRALSVT